MCDNKINADTDIQMHPIKEKILFVDDSITVRKTAAKILATRYEVIEAVNGEDAWDILQLDQDIKIVFADIQMPVLNGLQLLIKLKNSEDEYLTGLPVIMVTGESDSEATMRAVFEMGATDFIGKPFKAMDLLTRAYSYLKLTAKVKKLNELSGIDRQTGLYNATQYKKLGEQVLSLSNRNQCEFTVAYLEVRDFQQLKLTHGENISAQLLKTIAGRFAEMMRKEDIVARIGIARFAMIFPATSRVKASSIMQRICDTIHKLAFDTGNKTIHLQTTIGITSGLDDRASTFDEVNLQAECALMIANNKKSPANVKGNEIPCDIWSAPESETKNTLLQSLLHLMDGDYSKINDNELQKIIDRFSNFSDFIEKCRPSLSS